MSRATSPLLAAAPLALLAACADGGAPTALPNDARPSAALVSGGGGTTPIDPTPLPTCTVVSCPEQVGGGPLYAARSYGSQLEIVRLSPTGLVAQRLTDHPASDMSPALSPDGTRIAFWSMRDGGGVYVMNADGTGVKKLASAFLADGPSWSPDGTKLAVAAGPAGSTSVYIISASTGAVVTKVAGDATTGAHNPAWSPDGQSILYVKTPGPIADGADQELYRYSVATGTHLRLTTNDTDEMDPTFTPNGQYLAYVSAAGDMSNYDVMVRPTTLASGPQILLTGFTRKQSLTFSPDGKWFAYSRVVPGQDGIEVWRTSFPNVSTHVQVTSSSSYNATPGWKN